MAKRCMGEQRSKNLLLLVDLREVEGLGGFG